MDIENAQEVLVIKYFENEGGSLEWKNAIFEIKHSINGIIEWLSLYMIGCMIHNISEEHL